MSRRVGAGQEEDFCVLIERKRGTGGQRWRGVLLEIDVGADGATGNDNAIGGG